MKYLTHSDECHAQYRKAPNAKAMAALKCICGGVVTPQPEWERFEEMPIRQLRHLFDEAYLGTELANEEGYTGFAYDAPKPRRGRK